MAKSPRKVRLVAPDSVRVLDGWLGIMFVVLLGVVCLFGLWFECLQYVVGPSKAERQQQYRQEAMDQWKRDHPQER